ncbi:glycogen debranching protein [Solicola sp. PLA-1-18]|uniref:glycogen debranching protein n=1 Tax=Solicola sp. PLA-1-18 TaxID=3380532 RepID=UPI003B7B1A3A
MRRPHPLVAALAAAALAVPLLATSVAVADDGHRDGPRSTRTPELSTSTRLADRRSLVVGDRFWQMGTEDGGYPATGFHTRGEMGGFWTPPVKVLDGLWFRLGDTWLTSRRYTNGWGYQEMDLGTHGGVSVTRTDFAPDGLRAGLVGLRLSSRRATTVDLAVDAHSELMKAYPWGETTPGQSDYNLQDTGAVSGRSLLFREDGTPPVANAEGHHYAALVGSDLTPTGTSLGPDHRGPQDPAVICPPSGEGTPTQPARCDDTAYGRGTGGQLRYRVTVPAGGRTVWFSVDGSDRGVADARAQQAAALRRPAALLRRTIASRREVDARTRVSLPGDRLLERSIAWSKQNLAQSVQESRDLQVRTANAGESYPAPTGTVRRARWFGAGFPDYPWLFATDGEYSAYAAVASGQIDTIKAHLRALRDVSLAANGTSGKVVHEVTPDGTVFFGANADAGNTDETAKFPSIVALVWRWTGDDAFRNEMYSFARSNMRYIYRELDADGDGWPEGNGNVETPGLGEEKLDNAVYTIRGLRDLADLATSVGDDATRRWATTKAQDLESRFDRTWWFGPTADQYADSLDGPDNTRVFQRHWIGLTPVEAELTRPGRVDGPLAPLDHARTLVAKREEPCFTGTYGQYHTGSGRTSVTDDVEGPSCDSAVSTVPALRTAFTLNTALMAVAEGALGRMGASQQRRYTDANATVQLDPDVWELPGAMPEIAPSPDAGTNIDKLFTERSMVLQAWGTYGTVWPVVHQQLGIAPDLGRDELAVVPQVPDGQRTVAGSNVRLGSGAVAVTATRSTSTLRTRVRQTRAWHLTIGALVPAGERVREVRLDGRRVRPTIVTTARGTEVRVDAGSSRGTSRLTVSLR